jgi:hypothetical protein
MGKEKPIKRAAGSEATKGNVEGRLATARLSTTKQITCKLLYTCNWNQHACPGLGICYVNGGRSPTCKTNNVSGN